MISKMTKGAKLLTTNHLNYLQKERDVSPEIEHNKNIANYKENPSKENKEKIKISQLELEIFEKHDIQKEKFEIKYSGSFKQELYHKGFKDMKDREKLECVKNTWNEKIEKYKDRLPKNSVGHRHFILSPNPTDLDKLSNKSKIEVLDKTVRDSMRKFSQKYIDKGDSINYCFSVHTDKSHTHAHVYMNPVTKNGEYVSMNAARYYNKDQIKMTGRLERISNKRNPENKLNLYKKMVDNSFNKELKKERIQSKNRNLSIIKEIPNDIKNRIDNKKINDLIENLKKHKKIEHNNTRKNDLGLNI